MSVFKEHGKNGGPDLDRRTLLQAGLVGAAGLVSAGPLGAALGPRPMPPVAKAKSVIQIWMWGGPSHLDTFDPKPEAGHDYCGPLTKAIPTKVEGIQVGQLLPELAKLADKYAIIRGMTHGINGHETASYIVQTGHKPGGRVVYPGAGAVVSYFKGIRAGYKGLIPPYIVLTQPQGRFAEEGFLGTDCKPFATGGDPAASKFLVEGIVARGISRKQQQERRNLLRKLDTLRQKLKGTPAMDDYEEAQDKAYNLILGDGGKVFDLSKEKAELRQRYGRNTFGQSCLAARRLVEKGVPYVTINYRGWDTHKSHFPTIQRKQREMDLGMSALLKDLDDRGLLDSTIVWWGGEFGRTPRIQWQPPWNGGRSHYGLAFSSVLAGGGFKGGRVVGATDEKGETVVERKVYPWDLIASIYTLMGIDPMAKLQHPQGYKVSVLPSDKNVYESGGLLKEIM